ncbi:cytochrome c3-like protein [Shimia isoporae]|uniref:Cytochrome c3-like protein n=1 Tax=Shimia isoporae TaxID=647720 RepID=A0A4R1NW00_9RHOB|nr:cytochrome c3 family protein [Shimia isoporae]TCL09292.1 cytochrome c3-like protein [Shimia isoporae]
MKAPTARQVRIAAVFAGLPMFLAAAVVMTDPIAMPIMAHGPIQASHESIQCEACHQPSPGTARQQVQGKLHFLLGLRETPVDFGFSAVTSKACLACHERPNERHPIYRFQEPRFQASLALVEATSCLGCHSEHTNHRASIDLLFCQACHEDLKLKSDPLDVNHETLIANLEWQTCLGCHDFHGNHKHQAPTLLEAAIPAEAVLLYLQAGPSPYPLPKLFKGREGGE